MMKIKNQKGSVLIACTILTLLVLTGVVQYCQWVSHMTRANVYRVARQKALLNAESGIQIAVQYLRTPKVSQLEPGEIVSSQSLPLLHDGTTFYLTLLRDISDQSLVSIYSTGYYQLEAGSAEMPTGRRGQAASIFAQVRLRNAGEYFAATPGTLKVDYGSDISNGIVYGKDLVFNSGTLSPQTKVKAAFYFSSVSPANYASFVTFVDGPPAQLGSEPLLPVLDSAMRFQYETMAQTDILPMGATLSGSLPAAPLANPYHVYYSPGDVILGTPSSDCTLTTPLLIYSQGDIYIANNLNKGLGGAWPALLAEGNIYIREQAPEDLTIDATMITNGLLKAQGNTIKTSGTLRLTGGIISGQGVALGGIYKNRAYAYKSPESTLPLPFATQTVFYKITSGRFSQ